MTTESPLARFILGVIMIILLDTIGAFASNKFNFKYIRLIPLSFAIYAFVGFILAKVTSYPATALYTGLLGLFDGTIGLKLSIYCKAYMGLSGQLAKMQSAKTAVMMILIGIVVGSLGYALGQAR